MRIKLAGDQKVISRKEGLSYFIYMFEKYTGRKIIQIDIINGSNNDLIARYDIGSGNLSDKQRKKIRKLGYKICE